MGVARNGVTMDTIINVASLISVTTLYNAFVASVIECCPCRVAARELFKSDVPVVVTDGDSTLVKHTKTMLKKLVDNDSINVDDYWIDIMSDELLTEYGGDMLGDFFAAYRKVARTFDAMWWQLNRQVFSTTDY